MIELLDAHDVGERIKVKEYKLREMVAKGGVSQAHESQCYLAGALA